MIWLTRVDLDNSDRGCWDFEVMDLIIRGQDPQVTSPVSYGLPDRDL